MGFIPNEVIQEVLDRCDIVELISTYIPLKRSGQNFKGLSPFQHEKTASFFVSPKKQIFHCFSSGMGGNAITFVMKMERLEFPEAVQFLADKVGVVIPKKDLRDEKEQQKKQVAFDINRQALEYFHKNLISDRRPSAQQAREYLKSRNVNLEDAKRFQLGYALEEWDGLIKHLRGSGISLSQMESAGLIVPRREGQGFYDRFRERIIFPIFDIQGRCVAFGARTMQKENTAKYVNSPETDLYTKGKHLYGFHLAKDAVIREDRVLVVEGYMDFMVPFKNGIENIVASLGTALTIDQIRLLRRYTKNVVMLFDADLAGQSAMLRSIDLLIAEDLNVKLVCLAEGHDPDSFVQQFGAEALKKMIESAESIFDFKLKLLLRRAPDSNIETTAQIAVEMLATIDQFSNAIVKSEYIRRLAHELRVKEDTLWEELKKLGPKNTGRVSFSQAEPSVPVSQPIRPVERDLVHLMLEDDQFIDLTKSAVELDDFQNSNVRDVVKKIFDLFAQGQKISPASLVNCFDDEKVSRLISAIVSSSESVLGNKHKVHEDCIKRLRQERVRSQRQKLQQEMQDAKNIGDQEKLDHLVREFNQLIKG